MPNRYWVAPATGKWNDTANWSATSGGTGGASVPGSGDAVFLTGNTNCLIDVPVTVESITTTGYNGNLVTLAPLTCTHLQWTGKQLFLADSQIGTLEVQRSNANGSTVLFDPWCGASYAPTNLTWVKRAGNNMTFQWDPVPHATSYRVEYSSNNGGSWTLGSGGGAITTTAYTGTFISATNYLFRVQATTPKGTTEWSSIPFNRTVSDFTISFVSSPSVHLSIGSWEIASGVNVITLENNAETRLTGDVTIPSGITLTQGTGAKLTLFGTQDQNVTASSGTPEFSLHKAAGKVTFNASVKLRSNLLRAPSEIDPRTATLLDIVVTKYGDVQLTGDVAARSFVFNTQAMIPSGVTLDTYSCSITAAGEVAGNGTIRVCQGQFLNDGSCQPTIVYWVDATPPTLNPPTSISAAAVSTTGINVTVGIYVSYDVDNIYLVDYVIERSINGVDGWQVVNTASWYDLVIINSLISYTYNNTGLTPSTTYYYRAYAKYGSITSNYTAVVSATTQSGTPPPAKPDNFTPSVVSSSQIDLSWSSVAGATGYKAQRSTDQTSWTDVYTGSGTNCSATGLTANTFYHFQLAAYNIEMAYGPPATTTATTLANTAGASTLSAGTITTTSIVLNWTAVSGATGYRLERSPDGTSNWSSIYTGTNLTHTDTGRTAGTTYHYRVFATNTGGDSPASNMVSVPTLCVAPTGVTATAQNQSTDIVIAWSPVTGATGYVIEWSTNGTSGWTPLTQTSQTTLTHNVGAVNTRRYLQVKAVNASGSSAASSVVNTLSAPAAPTNPQVTNIGQTQFTVTFTPPAGATKNKVEVRPKSVGSWTTHMDAAGTSCIVTGLAPATEYDIQITSDNL